MCLILRLKTVNTLTNGIVYSWNKKHNYIHLNTHIFILHQERKRERTMPKPDQKPVLRLSCMRLKSSGQWDLLWSECRQHTSVAGASLSEETVDNASEKKTPTVHQEAEPPRGPSTAVSKHPQCQLLLVLINANGVTGIPTVCIQPNILRDHSR